MKNSRQDNLALAINLTDGLLNRVEPCLDYFDSREKESPCHPTDLHFLQMKTFFRMAMNTNASKTDV